MSDQDLQNATDEEMDAFLSWLFGPGKRDDETDSEADSRTLLSSQRVPNLTTQRVQHVLETDRPPTTFRHPGGITWA